MKLLLITIFSLTSYAKVCQRTLTISPGTVPLIKYHREGRSIILRDYDHALSLMMAYQSILSSRPETMILTEKEKGLFIKLLDKIIAFNQAKESELNEQILKTPSNKKVMQEFAQKYQRNKKSAQTGKNRFLKAIKSGPFPVEKFQRAIGTTIDKLFLRYEVRKYKDQNPSNNDLYNQPAIESVCTKEQPFCLSNFKELAAYKRKGVCFQVRFTPNLLKTLHQVVFAK